LRVTAIETPATIESASETDAPAAIDVPAAGYRLATGLDACERLLSVEGLPPEVELRTQRRMADLAPMLEEIAPSTKFHAMQIPLPAGWSAIGASIAFDRTGVPRMLVESGQRRGGTRHAEAPGQNGTAHTRNAWIELTADFRPRSVRAVEDAGTAGKAKKTRLAAFHGGRLFADDRGWWVVARSGEPDSIGSRQRLLGRMDGPRLRDRHALPPIEADDGADWVPVADADGDAPRFMATISPTDVLRYDAEAGALTPVARQLAPLIARRLGGGSPLLPFAGGYLCLASERVEMEEGGCRTVHRWLWFDSDWNLARLSGPLALRQRGVETVRGLARIGDELVLSVVGDPGAVSVARVSAAQVEALLAPPLALDLGAIERQLEEDPALLTPEAPTRVGMLTQIRRGTAPTIVSMTMTGSNRDIIGDALRSVVDWVDCCLLIDTGISDDTIAVARAIAGDKLEVREFPWCNDFSAARNFCLTAAAETGADWAVTVDSDERMNLNGVDIRAALAATAEPALLAPHGSGTYTKDRFFRLPAAGAFKGPTHEAYYRTDVVGGATVSIPGVIFDELVKSPEQIQFKDERDRAILSEYVKVNSTEPRWFYYLGDVLQRLGRHDEAIAAFRACTALRGWSEESAWAMYRAGESYVTLGRFEDALECCAIGMTRHVGLADLHWFAAYLSLQAGRPEQAVLWARQSIALGNFAGAGKSATRTGWRYPWGLWEGPYDILRFALRQLGRADEADEAERLFHQAAAARRAQPANV
jgi:tetratricopeptide (TPR) repeat protein